MRHTVRVIAKRLWCPLFALGGAFACASTSVLPTTKLDLRPVQFDTMQIRSTLVLVGDGGETGGAQDVWRALRTASAKQNTTVFFLGDNVYPAGVPADRNSPAYRSAVAALQTQMESIGDNANAVFVPGNHDWEKYRQPRLIWQDGRAAIERQAKLVEAKGPRFQFAPYPGCSGPEEIATSDFRVLVVDTEWWLASLQSTPSNLPVMASDPGCRPQDAGKLVKALRNAVDAAGTLPLIVVGHHPLASSGKHSRRWPFSMFNSDQDLTHRVNKIFRDSLNAALSVRRPLLYASGHDHDIELFSGTSAQYFLVTGAASPQKVSAFYTRNSNSLFGNQGPGFAIVNAMANGGVVLRIVSVTATGMRIADCRWLAPVSNVNHPCS